METPLTEEEAVDIVLAASRDADKNRDIFSDYAENSLNWGEEDTRTWDPWQTWKRALDVLAALWEQEKANRRAAGVTETPIALEPPFIMVAGLKIRIPQQQSSTDESGR